jgi:hypothetical protein
LFVGFRSCWSSRRTPDGRRIETEEPTSMALRVLAETGLILRSSLRRRRPLDFRGVPVAAISGAVPKALGPPRWVAGSVYKGAQDRIGAHGRGHWQRWQMREALKIRCIQASAQGSRDFFALAGMRSRSVPRLCAWNRSSGESPGQRSQTGAGTPRLTGNSQTPAGFQPSTRVSTGWSMVHRRSRRSRTPRRAAPLMASTGSLWPSLSLRQIASTCFF